MKAMTKVVMNDQEPSAPETDSIIIGDLAALKNRIVRSDPNGPPLFDEPIPSAVRSRMEARLLLLTQALAPASKPSHNKMARAIKLMSAAFTGAGTPTVDEAAVVIARYVDVLQDLPCWAVVRACTMLERGDVEGASLDFRPSAPRIRNVAVNLLAPWLAEMREIKRMLSAEACERQDAGMRERVHVLLQQLASQMRRGSVAEARS